MSACRQDCGANSSDTKRLRHPKMGWAGIKNGALLALAVVERFDVFLTVDRNLSNQQKLSNFPIAVIVLRCPTNDINDLKKLLPHLMAKLSEAKKGEAMIIS